MQLRLFHEPKTDIEELEEDFEQIVKKVDNFRQNFYGKLSTLSSEIRTLQAEISILQAQMYIQEKCMKNLMEKLENHTETKT